MTKLNAFMQQNAWTDQHLAGLVGRDRSTITKIRLGISMPSLDVAVQIERITDGQVPAASFIAEQAAEAAQ